MREEDFAAGTVIVRAGEYRPAMFQVIEGYVRLNRLRADGNETLITIYIPGNVYAETTLVAHRPYNHTSVAMVDTRLRVLDEADFWDIYADHPAIADALCRKFADTIGRQITSREFRASLKIGQLIVRMFDNFATLCAADQTDDGIAIAFPFTQGDIATLFDVTRQTVHREISRLRSLGLVDKRDGIWLVRDLDRLRRLAG